MKPNNISIAVLMITALPIFVLQAQQQTTQSDVSAADLAVIQSQLTPDEFKEFQNWVSIGPGGLPHTLEGYRTLQALNKKLRDPLDVSNLISKIGKDGDVNSLKNLPKRSRAEKDRFLFQRGRQFVLEQRLKTMIFPYISCAHVFKSSPPSSCLLRLFCFSLSRFRRYVKEMVN